LFPLQEVRTGNPKTLPMLSAPIRSKKPRHNREILRKPNKQRRLDPRDLFPGMGRNPAKKTQKTKNSETNRRIPFQGAREACGGIACEIGGVEEEIGIRWVLIIIIKS
jgi:hypothetical protein